MSQGDKIEELILEDDRLSPHYILELTKDGPLDALEVIVEARSDAANEATHSAIAASLAHHIKSGIGISSTVTVAEPGQVERSGGKAKRIRDLR